MNDTKLQILDEIEKHGEMFKRISPIQYRIRCPICGDSEKNLQDAHCYIKCSYDPNEPLLYKCFLCNASGRVNRKFLSLLNVDKKTLATIDSRKYFKMSSVKAVNIDLLTGDPIPNSKQIQYIENRVGSGLKLEDYDKFKIVWDIKSVYPYLTDKRDMNILPSANESIAFLSDDKAKLLVRYYSDDGIRWKKIKLYPSESKSFYTIKATLDLFTKDPITVNIAEGVMDVISIYKNFNDGANSAFIATLGSDYTSAVDYAIGKGFAGNNITLKIYIDSDIDVKLILKQMKKYKWIFGSIVIYKNIKSKDVGTTIDKIQLVEYKV